MTRVVISQPMYFPWYGFMAQMSLADVYIWLDDAQFSKGSFTNRVQVKTESGIKWMSVPLDSGSKGAQIKNLIPAHKNWQASHNMLLSQSFKKQLYSDSVLSMHNTVTMNTDLIEILIESVETPARAMNILPKKILRSSQMGIEGNSSQRVLKLVQEVGGTDYITGHGALSYLNHEAFEKAGISVSYMNYVASPWPQSHGVFVPNVTILDLLSSVGSVDAAKYFVCSTQNWKDFKKQNE